MKKKVKLSSFLKPFKHARKNGAWYMIPRALYPSIENMRGLHKVFQKIQEYQYIPLGEIKDYQVTIGEDYDPAKLVLREWDNTIWESIYKWMIREGIISPIAGKKQSLNDKLANVRNYRNFITKLGFGFINSEKHFYISQVGADFLQAEENKWAEIIEGQLCRLQLWNPSLDEKDWPKYLMFSIFPYLVFLKIVTTLKEKYITSDEFTLFVAPVYNEDLIEGTVKLIEAYRSLSDQDRARIRKAAKFTYPETANTKMHLDLFALTNTFAFEEHNLVLKKEAHAQAIYKHYRNKAVFVEYENFDDWYAFIGQRDKEYNKIDTARYYAKIGKVKQAEKVLQESVDDLPAGTSLADMLKTLFLEKHLEEAIYKNVKLLDANLTIEKNGRQFPTEIGRIDLLAKNNKTGEYVVIELKRDRVSDKVMGQCLRYMGWVHLNLSKNKIVKGIIVGSKIEPELEYAKKGLQHPINDIITLKSFEYEIQAGIK